MADMIFCCPACNNFLVVDEKGVDKSIKCPFCKTTVQVPRPHLRTGCPACGNLLRAPDFMRTKTIDCPKCNQSFVVSQNIACNSCGKNLPEDAVFCVNCGVDQRTGSKPSIDVSSEKKIRLHRQAQSAKRLLSKSSRPVEGKSPLTPKRYPVLIVMTLLGGMVGGVIYLATHYAKNSKRQETVVVRDQPKVERPIVSTINSVPAPKENIVVKHILKTLEKVKSNPADPSALNDLSWCVENVYGTGNGRNVLAGLKSIYALQQLYVGNESNGLKECESIRKFYSDTKFSGIIDPAGLYTPCSKCQNGKADLPCTRCVGTGICPSCKNSKTEKN